MLAFLFSLITLFSQPEMSVAVSVGIEDEIPSIYTPLHELDHLQIRSSYWAKVTIDQASSGTYILQGGKNNLKKIQFYNHLGELIGIGNHVKIQILTTPETYYLYYPFVDEKDGDLLSIKVEEEVNFFKSSSSERGYQLAFHAFLSFPMFVAIVLALRTRELVYVYYALYILATMWFFGYQYGLLGELVPLFNEIPPMWVWFFSFLLTLFYLLFSTTFLDLKKYDPFSAKLIRIANWFIFIFFFISITLYLFYVDVQHSITYKMPFWAIQLFLIVWFIVRTFKHPSSIKIYYLTGFIILIVVSISGQILSASQNAADYNYLFQIGLLLEAFILALGLSARVNEIQKEKTKVQSDLIDQMRVNEELQTKYTDELENKVRLRTEALSKRNEENEVLLKEVHHRVKNNLQMITSMLSMRERRTDSDRLKYQLASTKNKIKSMALIHEHLYLTSDFSNINLSDYITRLCDMIIDSLHKEDEIDLRLNIQELSADIETAIPLGIMINELVTNSIKYGLANNSRRVLGLTLNETNDILNLTIFDSGKGIAAGSKEGLGLTIIRSVLDNMDGSMEYCIDNSYFQIILKMGEYKVNALKPSLA